MPYYETFFAATEDTDSGNDRKRRFVGISKNLIMVHLTLMEAASLKAKMIECILTEMVFL